MGSPRRSGWLSIALLLGSAWLAGCAASGSKAGACACMTGCACAHCQGQAEKCGCPK